MSIQFACECGKKFRVDESLAGRRMRCKGCGAAVSVPLPAGAAMGEEAPIDFDALVAAAEAEARAVPSEAPPAKMSSRGSSRTITQTARVPAPRAPSGVIAYSGSRTSRSIPRRAGFNFPGSDLVDRVLPLGAFVGFIALQLFNFVVAYKQVPDQAPAWPLFLVFFVSNLILFLVLIPLTMSGAFVIARVRHFELPESMYMRTAAALMSAVIVTRLLYADAILDPGAYAKQDAMTILILSQGVCLAVLWLLWRFNLLDMILSWIASLIISIVGGGAVIFAALFAFNLISASPRGTVANGRGQPSIATDAPRLDPDRNVYAPPRDLRNWKGRTDSMLPAAGYVPPPPVVVAQTPRNDSPPPPVPQREAPKSAATDLKIEAGKPIDLLQLADPTKDSLAGDWSLRDGTLSCEQAGSTVRRLQLPAGPAGDFELSIIFNRKDGTKEFCVLFPVNGQPAQLWLGGMDGQSSSLEGAPESHAGRDAPRIANKEDQHLVLHVTSDHDQTQCSVTLDGKPYITWSGPTRQLSVAGEYTISDPRCIGLAVHPMSSVEFKQILLQPLGSAKVQKLER